jgi:septal ring factor EnvC (AmiA/AmiB activator)
LKKDPNYQLSIINHQLLKACAAAADELKASRELIDALELENTALKSRIETEKQTTALLGELNESRKSETEALRAALAAKNEALAAKDALIASQDKMIDTLKRKKSSPWRRVADVLIGIGLTAILK